MKKKLPGFLLMLCVMLMLCTTAMADVRYDGVTIAGLEDGKIYCHTYLLNIEVQADWDQIPEQCAYIIVEEGMRHTTLTRSEGVTTRSMALTITSNEISVLFCDSNGQKYQSVQYTFTIKRDHPDSNGDFRCDGCGEHVHHDTNQDHKCDGCSAVVSSHEDENGDHLCDLYGAACGSQSSIGPHEDTDGDHLCEYCGKDCHTDADKDHVCETCGGNVGVCEDDDFDGQCDYGCGKTFTYVIITSSHVVCPDSAYTVMAATSRGWVSSIWLQGNCLTGNQCDAGLIKKFYQLDSQSLDVMIFVADDHGGHSEQFTLSWGHSDVDDNHKCDGCGATVSQCVDADKDHSCDYVGCNEFIGECSDPDLDHNCDYGCGKTFGECSDPDLDHQCDYGCGKTFGECSDPDLDHNCDYGCGKTFGECSDPDLDHQCDYGCGKTFGECSDPDLDHQCDYGCGKTFGECSDPDLDHQCDYGCGKVLSDHSYTAVVTKPTCTADGFTTYTCTICGDTYTADTTRTTGHWYGLWGADGQQAHTALCRNDNCRHTSAMLCMLYEVTADASGTLLTVCPVCGEFGEACFEELADAQITAIDRDALPRGEAIVRGLDKPFGDVLYAFTAVYEFAGEVQPFNGAVSVSLMLNADMADFRLVRVDVTPATADSARTETWTELAFTFADGKLTFETEHEGLFLLLPMK